MTGAADEAVVLAHAAATLSMAGLIWFVQVVHYPLLAAVGPERFPEYTRRHADRTRWVVAPPMLVEGVTAVWLVARPAAVPGWAAWLGLGLAAVNWVSTAAVQIPCHTRLARGFDRAVHRRLVRTNWVRTAAWTARGVLAVWVVRPTG
jgi:hypothetical protein